MHVYVIFVHGCFYVCAFIPHILRIILFSQDWQRIEETPFIIKHMQFKVWDAVNHDAHGFCFPGDKCMNGTGLRGELNIYGHDDCIRGNI